MESDSHFTSIYDIHKQLQNGMENVHKEHVTPVHPQHVEYLHGEREQARSGGTRSEGTKRSQSPTHRSPSPGHAVRVSPGHASIYDLAMQHNQEQEQQVHFSRRENSPTLRHPPPTHPPQHEEYGVEYGVQEQSSNRYFLPETSPASNER